MREGPQIIRSKRWLAGALLLMVFVLASCGGSADPLTDNGDQPLEPETEVQALVSEVLLSASAERNAPVFLDATEVAGDIYVHVEEDDLASVSFYVDDPEGEGEPVIVERAPPFDLGGTAGDGHALPFDTRQLEDGVHTLTAELADEAGQTRLHTATFVVNNAGDAELSLSELLWLSRQPDRLDPEPLEGATLDGDMYVYLVPNSPVSHVDFLLDGERVSRERYAFFDLATTEGDGSAKPFDSTVLDEGEHTVTARITRSGGEVSEVSARFTVGQQTSQPREPGEPPAPDPEPTPDPEPEPDPEPQPLPQPTAEDPIRVSGNGRFLETTDGEGVFIAADTMWGLMSLSRGEVDTYLKTRRDQGFNAILGPVVWGSNFLSPDGTNMTRPERENSAYYEHLDYIVDKARDLGLRLGLVVQWGQERRMSQYSSPQEAYAYGQWIGNRYKDEPHVFWFAAGEYNIDLDYLEHYQQIGRGIKAAVGDRQLVSIHPAGGEGYSEQSSSKRFHDESWLDFNAIQTWNTDSSTWERTTDDWNLLPVKPVFVSETKYEGSGVSAYRMRRNAYWSVFAGSLGFGYGHEEIWSGNRDGKPWSSNLSATGALDMPHLRKLIESRMYTPSAQPIYAGRQPSQAIVREVDGRSNPEDSDGARGRVAAMRDGDGRYFMVYVPTGGSARTVEVDMGAVGGSEAIAWWYDPDSGEAREIGRYDASGSRSFTTPDRGEDWVLVVDDASVGWDAPGE